jgi:hypothetical protein
MRRNYLKSNSREFLLFKSISLFCLLLILAGCNNSPNLGGTSEVLAQAQATYTLLNSTVLTPKCVSCHSDPNPSGQVSFSSYASTLASAGTVVPYQPYQSQIYMMTSTGQMPQGGIPLTSAELRLVYYWLAYGAPNN